MGATNDHIPTTEVCMGADCKWDENIKTCSYSHLFYGAVCLMDNDRVQR